MWCDTFDADLLKTVPGAAEALGDTAGVKLWTYSRTTDGAINCPSAWHTPQGLTSFFWADDPAGRPDAYFSTDAPVTACTFLEAVRDEWIHGAVISVHGPVIWRPLQQSQLRLMYDLRGWTPLQDGERAKTRARVRWSLEQAAARLRELLCPKCGRPVRVCRGCP